MKKVSLLFILLSLFCSVSCRGDRGAVEPTQEELEKFARCLTEQGLVMYGSITCSGCRAQRKAFGKAFAHITEIECNPHIENAQVDRCLAKKIEKTPTWIMESQGQEVKRLVGYQLLEDLSSFASCEL